MNFERNVVFDSNADRSFGIVTSDFNGDGLEDILIGNARQPNKVFIQAEDGIWEAIQLSEKKWDTYDVRSADLNGDGKPDILESNSDEKNVYYFNRF